MSNIYRNNTVESDGGEVTNDGEDGEFGMQCGKTKL